MLGNDMDLIIKAFIRPMLTMMSFLPLPKNFELTIQKEITLPFSAGNRKVPSDLKGCLVFWQHRQGPCCPDLFSHYSAVYTGVVWMCFLITGPSGILATRGPCCPDLF